MKRVKKGDLTPDQEEIARDLSIIYDYLDESDKIIKEMKRKERKNAQNGHKITKK